MIGQVTRGGNDDPWRVLLPLREKVSAKPTDEGSRRPIHATFSSLSGGSPSTPHPTRFAGHLLPQGEKGEAHDLDGAKVRVFKLNS
jgi:hypothetical protein